MDLITWNDSLNVGIARIDQQHRKLVSIINKLFNAMAQGKSNEILQAVFSELSAYVVAHFGLEEKYMKQYEYEYYEAHKLEHKYFIDKLNEFKLNFSSGSAALTLDILHFLKSWLLKHISGTDRKYIPLLKEKGLK